MIRDHIDDLSTHGIATPAIIYRLERIRAAHRDLAGSLPTRSPVYYSLKANPHPDVLRTLAELGCRAEVSSLAEMDAALAHFDPNDCFVTGPGKTADEIDGALQRGIRKFSLESPHEHAQLRRAAARMGLTADYLLRVRAPFHGRSSLRMSGRPSQYGIDPNVIARDDSMTRSDAAVRFRGLHFFPASNIGGEEDIVAAFTSSIRTASFIQRSRRMSIEELNLGGGFSAPFGVARSADAYPRLRSHVEAELDEAFRGSPRPAEISFESGRRLVAESGDLITTVLDVKQSEGRWFAVVDSGVNHLGGFAALRRVLRSEIEPTVSSPSGRVRWDSTARTTVVGPTGAPPDVLVGLMRGYVPRCGDKIVVPNVGAYGLTASLIAFLGKPVAREVVLDESVLVSSSRLQVVRVSD